MFQKVSNKRLLPLSAHGPHSSSWQGQSWADPAAILTVSQGRGYRRAWSEEVCTGKAPPNKKLGVDKSEGLRNQYKPF